MHCHSIRSILNKQHSRSLRPLRTDQEAALWSGESKSCSKRGGMSRPTRCDAIWPKWLRPTAGRAPGNGNSLAGAGGGARTGGDARPTALLFVARLPLAAHLFSCLANVGTAVRACSSLRAPARGAKQSRRIRRDRVVPLASLGVLAMTALCGDGAPRRQARAERVPHRGKGGSSTTTKARPT